jgi:carboxyl-terminal processing protease
MNDCHWCSSWTFAFRRNLVVLALISALCAGCQSPAPANSPSDALHTVAISVSKPPPLAVESFQAAWQIIRDTHFDTNFNGLDWNAVHDKFLPRIEQARSQEEVRDTIQSMLDLLNVSHLMILPGTPQRRAVHIETNRPPPFATNQITPMNPLQPPVHAEAGSIGLEVRVLNNEIVTFRIDPGSPAEEAGVKPGWILKRIDGEPAIDPAIEETKPSERQREFLMWHHAASLLKGPAGEPCVLVAKTDTGEQKTFSIRRAKETGQPAKLGNLPTMFTRVTTNEITTASGKRAGYLAFNLWLIPAVEAINRFVDANRNSDAIVIDLRGNLGGIGGMVMGVAGHFVNQRVSLGKMKMRDNELNFTASPRRVDLQMQPTNTFQGKLAIIVDAISLSSTELFAGGMQELGRARVFGQPTGGQALPALSDRLPNGDLLYHAVADFNTPKGRRLEGNGVIPDEIVPLRLEALRARVDEPLQAALRWIDSTPQAASSGVR